MIIEKIIPSTKFQNGAGEAMDDALRDPIGISRRGRLTHVLMSAHEYERLKKQERTSYTIQDLPEDMASALAEAEPPKWTEKYDNEV